MLNSTKELGGASSSMDYVGMEFFINGELQRIAKQSSPSCMD